MHPSYAISIDSDNSTPYHFEDQDLRVLLIIRLGFRRPYWRQKHSLVTGVPEIFTL